MTTELMDAFAGDGNPIPDRLMLPSEACRWCGGPLVCLIMLGSSVGPCRTLAITPAEIFLRCADCGLSHRGLKSKWVTA